jgi:hypothetical protein
MNKSSLEKKPSTARNICTIIIFFCLCLSILTALWWFCLEPQRVHSDTLGMIRGMARLLEDYAIEDGGGYPEKFEDALAHYKLQLPVDPRTNKPVKLKTTTISSDDWYRLNISDKEVANRFCDKCVVYYAPPLAQEKRYRLFYIDDLGRPQY